MEEQILKILKAGFYEFRNTRAGNWLAESYAKELNSMVMEFIEWLIFECDLLKEATKSFESQEEMIERLYLYWFNNIRNK